MLIKLFQATRLSRLPWPIEPMSGWARLFLALVCLLVAGFLGTLALIGALGVGWGAAAAALVAVGAIAAPDRVD